MEGGEIGSSAIPESVMNSVKTTLVNVENLRTHLLEFLSLSDPDVLAQMPPLQRAQAFFTLAKATTTLFACNFYLLVRDLIFVLIISMCILHAKPFNNLFFPFFCSEVEMHWSAPR